MTADLFCAEELLFLFHFLLQILCIPNTQTPWIIPPNIIGQNLNRDKNKKHSFTEVRRVFSFLITDSSIYCSQLIM